MADFEPSDQASDQERLAGLRDLLERSLRACDPDKRAALSREYRAVLAELTKLGARGGSRVDDLAARRRSRLAKSAGSDATSVSE